MVHSRCRKVWLGICASAILFAPACEQSDKPEPQPGPTPSADENPLVLGSILPLTGDVASYGKAAQRGIDLAVEEINAKGGINERKIKVIYEDDQGRSAPAIAAMQKLVSVDKVPLVFGSAASSVSVSLCPVANREKVVLITPISSSKELTEVGGPYFFRTCPSDVVQAGMMADWLKKDGHRKAGVIFVNNSWGQGLKDEFVNRFEAAGGKVVAIESCKEGERELRTHLSKIKEAGPDAIYGITYGREGGALLRQAKELAIRLPMYGADVWGSPELVETAQDAASGVNVIVPAKFKGAKYEVFAKSFKDRYGKDPGVYASYAYDMAYIVFAALEKAERGDALRAAIAATSYEGVTGLTEFDEKGDVVGKGFERKTLP